MSIFKVGKHYILYADRRLPIACKYLIIKGLPTLDRHNRHQYKVENDEPIREIRDY